MFHSVKLPHILKALVVVYKDKQALVPWQLRDQHLKLHDSSLHSTDLCPLMYLFIYNTKAVVAKRHFTMDLGVELGA